MTRKTDTQTQQAEWLARRTREGHKATQTIANGPVGPDLALIDDKRNWWRVPSTAPNEKAYKTNPPGRLPVSSKENSTKTGSP